jgi:hypothetical protein
MEEIVAIDDLLSECIAQVGLLGSRYGMGASYVYGLKPTVLYVTIRADVRVFTRRTS